MQLGSISLAAMLAASFVMRTATVAAAIPLPEHPRPDRERSAWINLNGEWTFDKLADIVRGVYIDSNGNGRADVDDTFGFASWTRSDVDHFIIDCGVRGCSRDEEGVPYITFNNPTTEPS